MEEQAMEFSSGGGSSWVNWIYEIGVGGIIFIVLLTIFMYAAYWKIFVKAGKPGWAAIIPIYNIIVLCEIVGKPALWIIWFLIPIVNLIFGIWLINLLSKSFGKGVGMTLGLLILPFIFYPVLGFGSATYQGPAAAK